jgi:hypothetical protein
MDNTHKLLLAMCEALGLDVETTERDGATYFAGYKSTMGGQVADYKTDKIVDYKVTKKEPEGVAMVPLQIQSKAWGCIINYIEDNKDNIELGMADFGDLRPMRDFMNRNCP